MRVLVTGANGFVGRHVVSELSRHGHDIIAFDIGASSETPTVRFVVGDVRDKEVVDRLVVEHQPEACIHLSAISFVPEGWRDPARLFAVNVTGTIHLLEAFRQHGPDTKFLYISSEEVYGRTERGHALTEEEPLSPDNPYAISKAAADRLVLLYAHQHHMNTLTARPCNHIGPGQNSSFVVASFAEQLIAIAQQKKIKPVLKVGNLQSHRVFLDVRDVARAYRLLIEHGKPGLAYNIGSHHSVTIQNVLDQLMQIIGVAPVIEIDTSRFRPAEGRPLLDTTRIRAHAGWQPEIPLSTTLTDIVTSLSRPPA